MRFVPRQIPMFKDGGSNNIVTNLSKQDADKFQLEERERKQALNNPPTMFEFKINDNVLKYPAQKPIPENPFNTMLAQGIYPTPYVPIPNPYYPTQNPMYPYSYMPNQIPIIKKYNINISNTNGDIEKIHDLYEDVLPQVNGIIQKTLTTLSERSIICQYLRSIFIKHTDGEDIQVGGSNNSSSRQELVNLLSHIKLMEINPYHFSNLTNNPYKTLPDDFLMFRSCYPVKLNMMNNQVQCAVDNISVNIRIYQMKVYDILADKVGNKLTRNDSDLWREVSYYEFIKEEILKKKICPNFIMMYAWYVTLKSGVDFVKLKKLKNDKSNNIMIDQQNKNNITAKLIEDVSSTLTGVKTVLTDSNLNILTKSGTGLPTKHILDDDKEIEKFALHPTNKSIVMITEAPNNNLFDWATRSYAIDQGPVKRMVQTGFHDIKIWQSIIFQLLVSMYILKINKIAIREFSIENNVYIKSLTKDENNIGYWKYKVEGIDFYVPNYGYLLLIDSKFNEIKNGMQTLLIKDDKKIKDLGIEHKILASMFNDDITKINNINKENMLRVFDTNNFKNGFVQTGGNKPPEDIIKMLDNIHKQISRDTNFIDILLETQSHFLHNRLGTLNKEIELDQIVKNMTKYNFKSGDFIAYKIPSTMNDSYIWSLYVNKTSDNEHIIFTIDHKELLDNANRLKQMTVSIGDIYKVFGVIDQSFKPNQKILEDDLLETCIINSN